MGTIQSEKVVAQMSANALQNAYSEVLSVALASKDGTTTLSGNTNAKDSIDSDKNRGDNAASKLQLFCVTINQVASDFEAVDINIANAYMPGAATTGPKGADSFAPDKGLFSTPGPQ